MADGLLGENCGNKKDSIRLAENQVPGQHYRMSNANGSINGGQPHVGPGRRIVSPIKSVEVRDLPILLLIADTGVKYEPRMSMRGDSITKVGTTQRSGDPLSEAVRHTPVADRQ